MATAVSHEEHGLSLPTRVTRARLGVLLLILSDAAFVGAMYVSQAYLHILNSSGQYRAGVQPPSVVAGLILAAVVAASAAIYFWGEQGHRAGHLDRYRTGLIAAWVLVLIALVGQLVVLFGLRYSIPENGFASLVMVMSAYHAVHLLVTALIGFLVLGRVLHGRIAGHEYITEVTGYWWYYVAATAVTTWLMLSFVR
jgi:heme/copper-type cytochrome/quinol oxidase subunit 3